MKLLKKIYSAYILVVFLLLLNSCTRQPIIYNSVKPTTFKNVFENYWNEMKRNYVYWDIDITNWDDVYSKYAPVFSELNMNNSNDVRACVRYFRDITKNLVDNHYTIDFINSLIADSSIFPAYERKKNLPAFHEPYPYWKIDTNYLDKGYLIGKNTNFINNGQPLTILYGTIQNKILYISFNHFSLAESFGTSTGTSIQLILQVYFSMLDNLPENIKGLIVDVRSNLGGDLNDLNFFAKHFVNTQHLFGYAQYKIGDGLYSFTPWFPAYINPANLSKNISKPIIILADNFSASTAEALVMFVKSIPNSTFIGETTFGATGAIINDSSMNYGSFTISNFMHVQTSSARFKYIDGKIYENEGFPPDIFIPFNLTAIQNGHDIALEKAIDRIQ